MANTLRIKRRTADATAPSTLASGELAYNEVGGILYYGKGNNGSAVATSIVKLGGESLDASYLTTGTIPAGRMPAFTGDVTTSAGAVATTIAANAVSLAKMAQVATLTLLGRVTAATGNVEALTAAQAKTVLAIAQADVAGLTTASSPTFAGGTLTGELLISYASGRLRVTDGTNTLVMGMWDGSNVRIETSGRPLYVVSYGGAISIGRSSGTNLVIDTSSVSWGSNALLHAGNYASYSTFSGAGTFIGNIAITTDASSGDYSLIAHKYAGVTKAYSGYSGGLAIYGGETGIATRIQAGGQYAITALTNGNVGIGTTSPSYKFQVESALAANATFTTNSNMLAMFKNTTSAVSAWGGIKLQADEGSGIWFSDESGTSMHGYISTRYTGQMDFATGQDSATAATVKMSILTSGNVGIGTTSPGYKLDVAGSAWNNIARIQSSGGSSGIEFYDSGTRRGVVYSDASGFGLLNSATNWALRVNQGTDTLYIPGNVGIGTTSPSAALHVSKAVNADWLAKFVNTGTNPYGLYVDTSANVGSQYTFAAYTNVGTGLLLQNNGLLGIGTATPLGILHVSSATGLTASWISNTAEGVDAKNWAWQMGSAVGSNILRLRAVNDANTTGNNAVEITRSGTTISQVAFPSTTGKVSIASTTAGASNAGALVVTGGGSFGNNGSASYFGGSVQIANAIISQSGNHAYITGPTTAGAFLTLQSGNATGGINFRDSAGNSVGQYYQVTDAWSFAKPTTFAGSVTSTGGLVANSFIQALGSSYMNMVGGDHYRFYNNSDSASYTFDVGSSAGYVTSLILGARSAGVGTDAITLKVRSATVATFNSTTATFGGAVSTTTGSAISYAAGETYLIWSDESEYSVADDATDSNYKTVKTFVTSKSGTFKFKFSACIQSGTYYWAWRVLKNGSTVVASGHYNSGLDSGETTSVHAYRRFVGTVSSIDAGDSFALQMVSSTGGGSPVAGNGQLLYAKEFRIYSTTPSVEHGGLSNVWGANVGIGTASPTAKLHVAGNEYITGDAYGGLSIGEAPANYAGWDRQLNLNGTGHARLTVKTATVLMGAYAHDSWHSVSGVTPGGFLGTYNNYPVSILVNAVQRMVFDTTGNVGIGTTSPSDKLSIVGSAVARGNISGKGTSTTSFASFSLSSASYLYGINNSPVWSIGNGSYTNNNTLAPDGSLTASTLTLSTAAHNLYQTITAAAGVIYKVGVWVKLGTATNFCIVVNNTAAWNTVGGRCFTSADGLSTTDWTHVTFIFTATGNINLHIGAHSETAVAQQTAGTVFAWNWEITKQNGGTPASSFNGSVSIASTTAGSAGAGALVVQGGLATGAASYFGGAVAITKADADAALAITASTGTNPATQTITNTGGTLRFGLDNNVASYTGSVYPYATIIYRPAATAFVVSRAGTTDLVISSTGAATFASTVTSTQFQSNVYRQQSGDRSLLSFSGVETALGSGTPGDTTKINANGVQALRIEASLTATFAGILIASGGINNTVIGASTPMAGSFTNVTTGEYAVDKALYIGFNNVANEKCDITLPNDWFWGTFEVTLTSSYNYQNAPGVIAKKFGLGLGPNGSVYVNSARYTEVMGNTPDNFAISDLTWDAVNSRYKIQIVHRTATANATYISIRGLVSSSSMIKNIQAGSVYTTDTTVFAYPTVSFPGNIVLTSTAASSSAITGALQVAGGIGVAGASFFGSSETYFQGSTGNTNLISTRAGTSNGATFQYKTGATLKWYHGLRGLVNDNFYIHNQSTDVSVLVLDVATNAATFAGAVTANGRTTINATGLAGSPTLRLNTSSASTFVHSQESLAANLTAGQHIISVVGKSADTKNSGYIGYTWAGNASNSNYVTIGHWGADDLFRVYGDGTATVGANTVLHAGNYNTYAPTLTGTGASGTWGINVTGNAASATTASNLTTATITGQLLFNNNVTFSGNPATGGCLKFNQNAAVFTPTAFDLGKFFFEGTTLKIVVTGGALKQFAFTDTPLTPSSLNITHTAAQGAAAFILTTSDSASANGSIRWKDNAGNYEAGIGSNFNIGDPGALEFLNGGTTNMILRSSGRLGIGTTAPSQKLEIVESGSYAAMSVGNGTNLSYFGYANVVSNFNTYAQAGDAIVRGTNGVSIAGGNGTAGVRIDSAGNVGIGTASPGSFKLNVNGDFGVTGGNTIALRQDQGIGTYSIHYANIAPRYPIRFVGNSDSGTHRYFEFGYYTGDSQANAWNANVVIDSYNGNVGIGTTTPGAKLQVGDPGNAILSRNIISSGGYSASNVRQQNLLTFQATNVANADPFSDTSGEGGKNWHIGIVSDTAYQNTNRFSIIKAGAERVTIDASGNVSTGDVINLGRFSSIATTAYRGISWHDSFTMTDYAIFKPAGAWTQPLNIAFYTGIKIGANYGYGGTKFYNNTDMSGLLMSVGDADNCVRVFSSTSSTSAATGALQVAGGIGVGAASYFATTLQAGNQVISPNFASPSGGVAITFDNGGTNVGSWSTSRLYVNGNVGIGTTSPAADGLTIRREGGDRRILLKLDRPNTAGLKTALQFTVSDIMVGQIQHEYAASNYNHMSFTLRSVGGADIIPLWLENSGNVGIGTTSPSAKLHTVNTVDIEGPLFENTGGRGSITIKSAGTIHSGYVQFGNANGNSRAFIDFRESTGHFTMATSLSAGYITFNTASQVERVRILSTGNVGIGTTGPTSKLAVVGATNSYATANGSYTGGGSGHIGWGGTPTFAGYSNHPGAGMGQNITYGDNPGGAAGGTFFGGNGNYTSGGGAALYALGGEGGYYASAGVGIYAKGGTHGTWAVSGQEGGRARASAGYFDGDLTVVNGNIILGTVDTTGLTGSNGLKVTSTTASSSTTTGAVIVSGGIGVVAASFFGGTVATGALTVTGAITATGNITAYFSDDRLKTRLGPITNALEKIKSLTGFYFEPNQTAQRLGYEKKTDVGVSAQEVQAILPEIIAPAPIDSKYMTVRYEKLIPLLIEAIKAQQRQIEELQLLVQAA